MNGEAAAGFDAAFAGPIHFGACDTLTDLNAHDVRQGLADGIYGAMPPPPRNIAVKRSPIQGENAERLEIVITVDDREFHVDAALWVPADADGPVPLICGLDFIGPIGVLTSDVFPRDPYARVYARPEYGAPDGRLTETLRGTSAYRWPVDLLCRAGYAVIVSCYGSWVPDDADYWTDHGVHPLVGGDARAISLWAWSISRLLDVAELCAEIDPKRMIVAGHSRLGKAALWAAANDPRIKAVFANQSGCAGSAPAAHPVGETRAQMFAAFPHWTLPDTTACDYDQHHLLALIAPRAVYLGGAKDDLWSDPLGSFAALEKAAAHWDLDETETWTALDEVWDGCKSCHNGPLGFHLRPGGHDLLPDDWHKFLGFMKAH